MTFSTKLTLICLIFSLVQIDVTSAKLFTLPGDPLWPTQQQIQNFSSTLTGTLLLEQDANYQVPHTYNQRTGPPRPAFIVKPVTTKDIVNALLFSSEHVLRISVKSTGHHHDVRNSVDNSLLLDMSNFNQKQINIAARTITVGPGLDSATIHSFVFNETNGTLVALSGAEPSIGITGWTLGGGHGRLTRLYGLGVDALLSVNLVLANGTLATASATSNPDLFRALRGGAGSAFGVIYSLTLQLFDDPGPMSIFSGIYGVTDDVANTFQAFMSTAPNYVGAYYITQVDITSSSSYALFVDLFVHCFGSNSTCDAALSGLYNLSGCYADNQPTYCKVNHQYPSYSAYLISTLNSVDNGGIYSIYLVSTALNLTTPGQLAVVNQWMRTYNESSWPEAIIGCYCNSILGGVSSTLDPSGNLTAVAPAMRNAVIAATCYVGYTAGTSRQDLVTKMDNWGDTTLKPQGVDGWVYWNEPQHNFAANDWQTRYWGSAAAYAQLRAVKNKYDPTNILTCYHCVGWEDIENVDPAVCPTGCSCSNAKQANVCVDRILPLPPSPPSAASTICDQALIFVAFLSALLMEHKFSVHGVLVFLIFLKQQDFPLEIVTRAGRESGSRLPRNFKKWLASETKL